MKGSRSDSAVIHTTLRGIEDRERQHEAYSRTVVARGCAMISGANASVSSSGLSRLSYSIDLTQVHISGIRRCRMVSYLMIPYIPQHGSGEFLDRTLTPLLGIHDLYAFSPLLDLSSNISKLNQLSFLHLIWVSIFHAGCPGRDQSALRSRWRGWYFGAMRGGATPATDLAR
nr:hypothetical protein CFP56_60691 [Quercus suber]